MKTVLFVPNNHIYANKIIKVLLKNKDLEIVAIVVSKRLLPNRNTLAALFYYLKASGAYYVLYQIIKVLFFKLGSFIYALNPLPDEDNVLFPYQLLAQKKGIPILFVNNINNDQFVSSISNMRPDLFISILFNQIFKPNILLIPSHGTINIHPALLPGYKGVSPVFWALANGEKSTGVTIHSIDNEKIDDGQILMQKKISIAKNDTEHSLYLRCIEEGINLLVKVLVEVKENDNIRIKHFKNMKIAQSYFSLPTKEAVLKFRKNGRKFFRIRELFYEK